MHELFTILRYGEKTRGKGIKKSPSPLALLRHKKNSCLGLLEKKRARRFKFLFFVPKALLILSRYKSTSHFTGLLRYLYNCKISSQHLSSQTLSQTESPLVSIRIYFKPDKMKIVNTSLSYSESN